jgi:hypothetical protein
MNVKAGVLLEEGSVQKICGHLIHSFMTQLFRCNGFLLNVYIALKKNCSFYQNIS